MLNPIQLTMLLAGFFKVLHRYYLQRSQFYGHNWKCMIKGGPKPKYNYKRLQDFGSRGLVDKRWPCDLDQLRSWCSAILCLFHDARQRISSWGGWTQLVGLGPPNLFSLADLHICKRAFILVTLQSNVASHAVPNKCVDFTDKYDGLSTLGKSCQKTICATIDF